jgi:hypothetical protein
MDALNIPSVNHLDSDKKPKDERALHKQRAVIMNKEDCVNSYKAYQANKQQKLVKSATRKEKTNELRLAKEAQKVRRDSVTKKRSRQLIMQKK